METSSLIAILGHPVPRDHVGKGAAMRCEQRIWAPVTAWQSDAPMLGDAGLVFYFGARAALACGGRHAELHAAYPQAQLLGCGTGGQIHGDDIDDEGVVAVAFRVRATGLRLATASVLAPGLSLWAGGGDRPRPGRR